MIIYQLFLVALIVKICYAEFMEIFHPFNPVSPPLLPLCPHIPQPEPILQNIPQIVDSQLLLETNTTLQETKDNLKFILPFLDMEIESDRNLHVLQEVQKQQIYILHGHELYQLFISRQEKRLSLVAALQGSVLQEEPLGAQIIFWQGNFILVIALAEHLEIYQLAENVLIQRAEAVKDPAKVLDPVPVFEAIQQLTLTGRFQKLFLFSPSADRIMIVAAVNFSKLYGKLRIFEWFNTYFDPIEEITVPSIHVVNVIGFETKYLVIGRVIKHQPKTILNVYEIIKITPKLLSKQTLTVESHIVHIFSYHQRNMIVACSTKQQKCTSFRQMPDGHFTIYRRRTSKEFAFDLMTSSARFVGAIRQNQVMIFSNHRLDVYASFISDQMDVTNLIGYQNSYKEDYVLLFYQRPFKTLVRIVELDIKSRDLPSLHQSEPEDVEASNRHHHLFESTIGRLRKLLLQRKMDVDKFQKVLQILKPKLSDLELNENIIVHSGNVGIIKITGEYLKSPKQIVQRIESLRQNYLTQRSKRSDNQEVFDEERDIKKTVKVKTLKVENLIYHGDVVEGFFLNQANLKEKILTIKQKVITHGLNTSQLILPQNLRQKREQTTFFDLTPSFQVANLQVDFINGVSWNWFYDSVFLKNRDRFIKGTLILQSDVKANHLMTNNLNGFIVSELFNLQHPQVIHSDLNITRIFVDDLKVDTVNGLVFEEEIVFSGENSFIETPVKIQHLSIFGDLFLANNTKVQQRAGSSNGAELQQFYTNKIFVNGSLIINNLMRLNNATTIILEDEYFDEHKIKEIFLLKEQAQNFSFPVIFNEAKVTATALKTKYLNDHLTTEHMRLDKFYTDKPLWATFMNAHVQGDVICRDYKSKIAEIKENIIHPGDKVRITGKKLFEASLELKNAEVSLLNHLPVKDLVFKTYLNKNKILHFRDTKSFSTIKVTNFSLVEQEIKASYLNSLSLQTLLSTDYYMERLHLQHLLATTNLVVRQINGISFDQVLTKLDVQDNRLILHKDLIVEGNVQFDENLELNFINDIAWNEYVDNLVRSNENAIVQGDVSFEKDLTITKKLEVTTINDQDLEIILKNILMKTKPQLISGLYIFDSIYGSNMDVWNINNVPVADFINLSENFTEIEADVIVENLYIGQNFNGHWNGFENLLLLKEKINRLTLKPWKSLYVLKNARWPDNFEDNEQQQLFKYFYKKAVSSNRDQIITGNVRISKPLIANMRTRFKFPANVDMEFIQQDAVLKNSPATQKIKGEKVFLKALILETLKAKHNLNTNFLNSIDVLRFNRSLYRLTSQEALMGPMKFLQPLTVGHLHLANGLINGLNTTLIYQLETNSSLPDVQLQELYIENDLFINHINDMSLAYFLDNRLTLKGPALEHFGVLTFENLIIEKKALMQSINGIAIDDLVFKHSRYLQTITGHKNIEQTLELDGPAHIMHLNDKDLSELYRNSLMRDQNYEFNNLYLEQATFEEGLQMPRDFNNETSQQKQQRSWYEIKEEEDSVINVKEKFLIFLKELKENLTHNPKDIIYLDYDFKTHIKWQEPAILKANKTIYHEFSRISCCEKQYLKLSFQHPNNIYLKNITSNRLTKIFDKISVKAENYCRPQKHKVKAKVSITGPKLLKVFGMKRYIETIYILQNVANSSEHFVVLHALDLPSLKRNEIRIFKISTLSSPSIREWQGLTQRIGEQLKLYRFNNLQILLTNGLHDHHPAITIYHFNPNSQLFEIQQTIDGDYDIIEMIELPNKMATKQLILSCSKCRRIFIYELNSSKISGKYETLQIITLKTQIDKLVIFRLYNNYYMLVISRQDTNFYNIYKYAHIQGWLHITFGYLPNLQMSIPITELLWSNNDNHSLMLSEGIPLMLLCNPNACYLLKAIY